MLKSLELAGFKSFADATRFEFSEGITAVVGPNGSGKSNVVDGIKWILGDQSAKSLRGKEMTDVIFNGARNRKAGDLSEATLTFDNSSGFLPVATQEVQIGRRLWRSGDSEYLINQESARLKDVRQLFLGTGAGSASYCIIEQGRVDQILQTNAASRRLIFEEAAGISLFKSRRAEFLRRMERVDQLLLRLTDIVDEVSAQRLSLRSQAEKAAKYRDLSDELRRLWLGLAADDSQRLHADIARIERLIAELVADIETRASQRQQFEERLLKIDGDAAIFDQQIREVQQESASIRETIAGDQATIELQTHRQQELDGEIERLMSQRSTMAIRLQEGDQELKHLAHVLAGCETESQRIHEQQTVYDSQLADWTASQELLQQQLDDSQETAVRLQQEIDAFRERLLELQTQRQAAEVAKTAAEQRQAQLVMKISTLREECAAVQLQIEKSQTEYDVAEKELATVRKERETLLTEQTQFRDLLATLREERSAGDARQSVLEDYENRQEGLGIGTREILRRAKTSHYSPWNQISGSVADLIDVDLENAALLEAALGTRAELIVIQEFDSLKEYLLENQTTISGRVGFVEYQAGADVGLSIRSVTDDGIIDESITEESASDLARVDLLGIPGVVSRAKTLAKSSESFAGLVDHILGDTWVVETLEIAFTLAGGEGRGCRFVTLQGELLEADGTLIVGTARTEMALVSRKSELRKLKTDLSKLERQIHEEEQRLVGMNRELVTVDEQIRLREQSFQVISERHHLLCSEEASRLQELKRVQKEQEALAVEAEGLADVALKFSTALGSCEMEQTETIAEFDRLKISQEAMQQQIVRGQDEWQQVREQRAAEELVLTKQQERMKGLRSSHERLVRDQQQRCQQRDEAERRFAGIREKQELLELKLLNARSVVAELFLSDESLFHRANELFVEKDRLRGLRAELRQEEMSVRDADRVAKERQHEQEIVLRDANHQLETLAERIEEEYQISLEDVAASGASAFQDYLCALREEAAEAGDVEAEDFEADELPAVSNTASNTENNAASNTENVDDAVSDDSLFDPISGLRFDEIRDDLEKQVNRLRRQRKLMGSVDTDSLDNLDEIETRYLQLNSTLNDLLAAKKHLEELVRKIDSRCKELFITTFNDVRKHFQELFRKAFGGGDGDIVLEDMDDVLECGIDIVARPPGKELKSITLMSGGEKTLMAFALLLAIFKHRPSPYCVLDEVDAALDEANVERLLSLLEEFKQSTQFVIITHKKPTMTIADRLYGVTMEQSGVSKRMTVRFDNIGENGEILNGDDEVSSAA